MAAGRRGRAWGPGPANHRRPESPAPSVPQRAAAALHHAWWCAVPLLSAIQAPPTRAQGKGRRQGGAQAKMVAARVQAVAAAGGQLRSWGCGSGSTRRQCKPSSPLTKKLWQGGGTAWAAPSTLRFCRPEVKLMQRCLPRRPTPAAAAAAAAAAFWAAAQLLHARPSHALPPVQQAGCDVPLCPACGAARCGAQPPTLPG